MVSGRRIRHVVAVLATVHTAAVLAVGIAHGQSSPEPDAAPIADDADSKARIAGAVSALDADAAADGAFPAILIEMLGFEFRTPPDEFRWAVDRMSNETADPNTGGNTDENGGNVDGNLAPNVNRDSDRGEFPDGTVGWGQIAVLSYLSASTGWSFDELVGAGAHREFAGFIDTMEMSQEKMAASLELIVDRANRERNSQIFDRIRSAPRTGALPDLGAGFGLFQESLDFRQLDLPGPTKVHGAVTLVPLAGGNQ